MASGIFHIRVECLTVSNALLKSNANTRTSGCVDNTLKTVWIKVMRAASVEPVGLNARPGTKSDSLQSVILAVAAEVPGRCRF